MKKMLGSLVLVGALISGSEAFAADGEYSALIKELTPIIKEEASVCNLSKIKKAARRADADASFKARFLEIVQGCADSKYASADAFQAIVDLDGDGGDDDSGDDEFGGGAPAPAKGAFLGKGNTFSGTGTSGNPSTGPTSPNPKVSPAPVPEEPMADPEVIPY